MADIMLEWLDPWEDEEFGELDKSGREEGQKGDKEDIEQPNRNGRRESQDVDDAVVEPQILHEKMSANEPSAVGKDEESVNEGDEQNKRRHSQASVKRHKQLITIVCKLSINLEYQLRTVRNIH
ncbi:hypothetical protein GYMLUDRAFT_59723 [Collybiopsis luxurians FD-317 M1]|uniref:Uncharacterized protein n=1 Tax=Collybiopsis luxurians FD-317 M1 TaxID=944289 RepID=A0A0D0CVD8_9AGAR|nr:hypothetical protein GYMLUDRAFT_59723 [Collybiopsis luxurians FD-317 M1]